MLIMILCTLIRRIISRGTEGVYNVRIYMLRTHFRSAKKIHIMLKFVFPHQLISTSGTVEKMVAGFDSK